VHIISASHENLGQFHNHLDDSVEEEEEEEEKVEKEEEWEERRRRRMRRRGGGGEGVVRILSEVEFYNLYR